MRMWTCYNSCMESIYWEKEIQVHVLVSLIKAMENVDE